MYKVTNKIGRLVEAKLGTPLSPEEVNACIRETRAFVLRLESKSVCYVDLREVIVFTQETASRFLMLFKADNPKIERTGLLLPSDNPVLMLQIERVIREAGHPERRTFKNIRELRAFLSPALSEAERQRLDELLWKRQPSNADLMR